VAKKHLLENTTPHSCGGGTVFFVSVVSHSIFSVPFKKASFLVEGDGGGGVCSQFVDSG